MKFIEFYLKNKKKFPELDFYKVKYSGNNTGYNSRGEMKYLERDMILMVPTVCSHLLKENLENADSLGIYAYFSGKFFNIMTESEREKYESLFLTSDNKILITMRGFANADYNAVNLKEDKERKILLNLINSFLTISGLDSKYFSIQFSSNPIYSSIWSITKDNFTSIKEYNLKLNNYKAYNSIKNNFKKIVLKK